MAGHSVWYVPPSRLYLAQNPLTDRAINLQCFLSVLAWIYLVMTPRWERSRKLAQPHAMAVVDGVFAIFWLSAFASQAAYNTANSCGNQCKVSKAIVGIAFFEMYVLDSRPQVRPAQLC